MGVDLSAFGLNLVVVLGVVFALILGTFGLAVRRGRYDTIDSVWGLGFAVIALVSFGLSNGHGELALRLLITALTVLWGLRLSVHIHTRNAGQREDPRYAAIVTLLQLMHPGLGAGVQYHSKVLRVLFRGDHCVGARDSRGYLRLARERRHGDGNSEPAFEHQRCGLGRVSLSRARSEYVFLGHATMFDMMVTAVDLFDHPLSDWEKEQLYAESIETYRLYGVSRLPIAVRERIGYEWTARDERWLGRFRGLVKAAWSIVPDRLRYSARYRAATRRVVS